MSPVSHEGLIPYDFGQSTGETWPLAAFGVWRDRPGVLHAITTRQCPLFSPDAAGDTNVKLYAALARMLRLGGIASCEQVHGPDVLTVCKAGPAGQADAMITDAPGLGLLARSADCPIVLLAAADGAAVGIVHASLRSTLLGIAASTVGEMRRQFSVEPAALHAMICPSAGPCCYEVGPEVLDQAVGRLGSGAAGFFSAPGGAIHFDLWAANKDQLVRQGLLPDNIHISGLCTICRNDMFPSFRVEGRQAGRFACLVARRSSSVF
ncbi:MAG: polyphenol oxidase family protein [Planctomycetes bacterium]|nr:polyphenol oxidase family protein [Planctomycetota bacterium]